MPTRRRALPAWWLAGVLLALAAGIHLGSFLVIPARSSGETQVFEIAPGENLKAVAARLKQAGLLRNTLYFVAFGRLTGADHHLKPGEYSLAPTMRPLDILDRFEKGLVVLYTITIPEGYTVRQIAPVLAAAGVGDPDDFVRLAYEPEFVRELGLEAANLEGYLFPDTYGFPKDVGTKDILRRLVNRFHEVYDAMWDERAASYGLKRHEVVTLASIIEKETGVDSERPFVSAVFHNRLRLGIPLQSDPTVIYGIPDFDGNLRRVDLRRDTPYNTYRRRGLPPGPISNPGRASLMAALFPAPVDYLYFVSRNDGTHLFSRSLDEHNRAVDEFQRRLPLLPARTKSASGLS